MSKHVIYLAGGSGRRFGGNKLLCQLNGKPLYRHGLDMLAGLLRNRQDCTLTVVSRYPEILTAAEEIGARGVDSPESIGGISCSIKNGIRAVQPLTGEDFLVFVVADQPWLGAGTMDRLLNLAGPGVLAAAASWEERMGNPALFSAALVPELMALAGDRGGRSILERCGPQCLRVSVDDPRELMDVDTRQALEGV